LHPVSTYAAFCLLGRPFPRGVRAQQVSLPIRFLCCTALSVLAVNKRPYLFACLLVSSPRR
jgi:hypothetical protein